MNDTKTIPKGWQKGVLGDFVIDIKDGGTPSRHKAEYFGGGIYWVVIKDIKPIIYSTSETLSELGLKNSSAKLFQKGTVILSFGATIGEVGIAGVDLATKQGIAGILHEKEKIDTQYLYFLLQSFKKYLNQIANGSTIKEVRPSIIKNIEVCIPPILEQTKIAEILSSVDEDIKKVDQEIKKTEELKRGLTGELLTKGIGHKKFKKVKIGNIPEKWSFLRMKDVCTVRQGLQIAILKRFKDIGKNRYKYITLKNIKEGIYEYIESPKESVICKKDDVLMTRTGNTGVVVTGVEGVFHNNFFLVDYNRNIIDKVFLVYYLRSKKIQDIILDRAGTTTIPDLNHGDFYSIPFIMPPKVEQGNISEILISIDSKIEINKKIKNKLAELKNGLMYDLLSGKKLTI